MSRVAQLIAESLGLKLQDGLRRISQGEPEEVDDEVLREMAKYGLVVRSIDFETVDLTFLGSKVAEALSQN